VLELRERIAQLRRTAVAASQMARQVELNIEIQKLQTQLAAAQEQL
jgi:predicted  nucleic acid-binding Zn-ribbon protein